MKTTSHWRFVCRLHEILPWSGVAALVDGRQVAVFRTADAVHALDNRDPIGGANVLSRGIVGDLKGELVVASPLYKHHFSLETGRCLEDAAVSVAVHRVRVIDGAVYLGVEPDGRAGLRRRPKLVVVGNGMAGMRAVEELIARAPGAWDITVIGAESRGSYNRVLLSALLAGEKRIEDVLTHPPSWYAANGVTLVAGDAVTSIHRARRLVRTASGAEFSYDRLLLATGSMPRALAVPGNDLPGVVGFRDLDDVDAMVALAGKGRPAVVIGGGLLGLEAAHGLLQRGMEVTVVHRSSTLMNRQLDHEGADCLRRTLEARGLRFRLSAKTVAVLGTSRVEGLRLEDGSELAADLVVMAVGLRPNVELAQAAGLRCDRGILVSDTLQTFDPRVYAVGECVQHRDRTFGLVAPQWDQARVCADHLAGIGIGRYEGPASTTRLRVSGVEVFSAGDFSGGPGTESLVLSDPRRGVYKRVVLRDHKVRGAVLCGDVTDVAWYSDLLREGRDVSVFRDSLLFGPPPAEALR